MPSSIKRIDARTLKAALHDGGEVALLDAREELAFGERHILMAACLPLGRIEVLADDMVPRRSARVVWCDDGGGIADEAARRMSDLGYEDLSLLAGGLAAWEAAGHRIYSGVHVPSKAFAEVVEHDLGTPWITAPQLKAMIDAAEDIAIFDSRSFEEYHTNSIPTAVSVPGAELVLRFKDLVPSAKTTVIVNCGGRTRSIIGAQSLINAGVPNKVVSLKNGTMAWHLAGFEVIQGAGKRPPAASPAAAEAGRQSAERIARGLGIPRIDAAMLAKWRAESDRRSLYVLDVRTPEEYAAGHVAGVRSAPGGQLVQETDNFLATWGARVVLADTDGARAAMTASWLKQMGWDDVAVIRLDEIPGERTTGPHRPRALGLERATAPTITPAELQASLEAGTATLIDLEYSKPYRNGHIPGAWFSTRTRLAEALAKVPPAPSIVITSPDGALARIAATELAATASVPFLSLEGGTRAWTASSYPLAKGAERMADLADDVWLPARERGGDRESAMRAYLAWEIDLVNQMRTDDDQRFKVVRV
ncbi:MAG: rhodanese-like domain-containing protein [Hyphomicrobiaceae bacterium]|nr:rhodanese-like domain-containing protein [Hyphomicrobiaceae bacterium]